MLTPYSKRYVFKGTVHHFWIYIFSWPNRRNIFCKRSISIKQLRLEIIEEIGCSKSVRPSTVIYIIYITRSDFEHHFSQLFLIRVILSRWTFYKKCFFCWDTKKMLYIQNWWKIPSRTDRRTGKVGHKRGYQEWNLENWTEAIQVWTFVVSI